MARILYSKIIERTVIANNIITQFIFFNCDVIYLVNTNEKQTFSYDLQALSISRDGRHDFITSPCKVD